MSLKDKNCVKNLSGSTFKEKYDCNGPKKNTIKRCYQQNALKCHPDKGGDEESFKMMGSDYAKCNAQKNEDITNVGVCNVEDTPTSNTNTRQTEPYYSERAQYYDNEYRNARRAGDIDRMRAIHQEWYAFLKSNMYNIVVSIVFGILLFSYMKENNVSVEDVDWWEKTGNFDLKGGGDSAKKKGGGGEGLIRLLTLAAVMIFMIILIFSPQVLAEEANTRIPPGQTIAETPESLEAVEFINGFTREVAQQCFEGDQDSFAQMCSIEFQGNSTSVTNSGNNDGLIQYITQGMGAAVTSLSSFVWSTSANNGMEDVVDESLEQQSRAFADAENEAENNEVMENNEVVENNTPKQQPTRAPDETAIVPSSDVNTNPSDSTDANAVSTEFSSGKTVDLKKKADKIRVAVRKKPGFFWNGPNNQIAIHNASGQIVKHIDVPQTLTGAISQALKKHGFPQSEIDGGIQTLVDVVANANIQSLSIAEHAVREITALKATEGSIQIARDSNIKLPNFNDVTGGQPLVSMNVNGEQILNVAALDNAAKTTMDVLKSTCFPSTDLATFGSYFEQDNLRIMPDGGLMFDTNLYKEITMNVIKQGDYYSEESTTFSAAKIRGNFRQDLINNLDFCIQAMTNAIALENVRIITNTDTGGLIATESNPNPIKGFYDFTQLSLSTFRKRAEIGKEIFNSNSTRVQLMMEKMAASAADRIIAQGKSNIAQVMTEVGDNIIEIARDARDGAAKAAFETGRASGQISANIVLGTAKGILESAIANPGPSIFLICIVFGAGFVVIKAPGLLAEPARIILGAWGDMRLKNAQALALERGAPALALERGAPAPADRMRALEDEAVRRVLDALRPQISYNRPTLLGNADEQVRAVLENIGRRGEGEGEMNAPQLPDQQQRRDGGQNRASDYLRITNSTRQGGKKKKSRKSRKSRKKKRKGNKSKKRKSKKSKKSRKSRKRKHRRSKKSKK